MDTDKEWIWGRREAGVGEAGRSGGRGCCGWDVLSKKRINKKGGKNSDLLLAIINHITGG